MSNISIENLEKYIFSEESKKELLENLIPKTREYYYFNCLKVLEDKDEKNLKNLSDEIKKNEKKGIFLELKSERVRILLENLKQQKENKVEKSKILEELNEIVFGLHFEKTYFIPSKEKNYNKEFEYKSEFSSIDLGFLNFIRKYLKDKRNLKKIRQSAILGINFSDIDQKIKKQLYENVYHCHNFFSIEGISDLFTNKEFRSSNFNLKNFSINQLEKVLKSISFNDSEFFSIIKRFFFIYLIYF